MDLQKLKIDSEYRTFRKDIISKFLIPVLCETKIYKRAVGYFSSSSLIDLSNGITGLVRNDGQIQLITSPHLSDKDYGAIKEGYLEKEKIVNLLVNQLVDPKDIFEEKRLNLLANLIRQGTMDIKIAFASNRTGMYHEKMGIVSDEAGNYLAFSGSLNESRMGYKYNYESIDVFCSWKNQDENLRIQTKLDAFNSIWNNNEPNIEALDLPEIKEEIMKKYLIGDPDLDIDKLEYFDSPDNGKQYNMNGSPISIQIPDSVSLYDFQIEAINSWEENEFVGIFDMATGTGKTFTALGGLVRLFKHTQGILGVIIVCPFQHLVEQWYEDIVLFGIKPIIGYSKSSQKDWKRKFINIIRDQSLGVENCGFFCLVTTNATFRTDFVQSEISKIKNNALLIADEAHNFGAESLRNTLTPVFNFRLALSATLERHNDEEGTQVLLDYFGNKCIEYSLERAIIENKLTEYYYHPIIVVLSQDELDLYDQITRELSACIIKLKNGKTKLSKYGEQLAIKRARVIAGAKDKLSALRRVMEEYKTERHILVYCGAANVLDPDEDVTPVNEDDLRQIDLVTDILGNELDMNVSQFTSKENISERNTLKREFESGDMLQVLIAIKCLDEGVNIPKIQKAIILASTTNPKEYIQRRGRVLRLATGKDYSEIFDFIALPYSLDDSQSLTTRELSNYQTMVRNELVRGYEFSRIALNSFEANLVLSRIEESYRIQELFYSIDGDSNG